MMTTALQECPRCGGAINRENFAVVEHSDRIDRFMACEFCCVGWEWSEYPDGEVQPLDFHERTEPRAFGKFLQRLEDARAA